MAFYEKHGFTENTDKSSYENMVREPVAGRLDYSDKRRISRDTRIQKMFGESVIVRNGKPLVVYHGTWKSGWDQ